jgi:hypothetical protein
MRSLIGMIVSCVAAFTITVLEIAHHVELIERSIPEWLVPMINEKLNFALILVALLVFIVAYFDYKSEKRKYAHLTLERTESQPVSTTQAAMPQPEFHKGIGLRNPIHNVQFVGFRKIQIAPDMPELALATLCFENVLISGGSIADFHFARLQVHYSDFSTGEEIAKAFLARWHDSPAAPIDIMGGEKKCAIIASCIGSKWATDALIDAPVNPALEYGFGGSEYKHESVPLPLGRIKIKATLIGTRNLSIPPIEGILTLGEDGATSFKQTI